MAPVPVAAQSLRFAFDALTAGNGIDPLIGNNSAFRAQLGSSFNGGGLSISYPVQNLRFIDYQPIQFSAGCGGISAHFGGISFVDGAEIVRMIQVIGQNAQGAVVKLALSTLCPQCETIINEINTLMEAAASLSINSCEVATAMVEGAFNTAQEMWASACSRESAEAGTTTDQTAGRIDHCNGADQAINNLKAELNTDSKENENAYFVGNGTWMAFRELGIFNRNAVTAAGFESAATAQILMSHVGATVEGQSIKGLAHGDRGKVLLGGIMCGWSYPYNLDPDYDFVKEYCSALLGTPNSSVPVLSCEGDFVDCDPVKKVDFFAPQNVTPSWDPAQDYEEGFLMMVYDDLNEMVDRVQSGQAFSSSHKNLIQISPFPLYRVLNVAAIYPAISRVMLQDYAISLSTMLALEYFHDVMNQSSKNIRQIAGGGTVQSTSTLPPRLMNETYVGIKELREAAEKSYSSRMSLYKTQEEIMTNVNKLDQMIIQSTFSAGLGGSTVFTADLN